MVAAVKADFGTFDILVNNAGYVKYQRFVDCLQGPRPHLCRSRDTPDGIGQDPAREAAREPAGRLKDMTEENLQ